MKNRKIGKGLVLFFSGVMVLGIGIPIVTGISPWIKYPILVLGVSVILIGLYKILCWLEPLGDKEQ